MPSNDKSELGAKYQCLTLCLRAEEEKGAEGKEEEGKEEGRRQERKEKRK
jgi:hypothetical protein